METEVSVAFRVSIAEGGANLNEICRSVKEAMGKAGVRVAEEIVGWIQEDVVDRLARPSGSKAKKGLGGHEIKGGEGRRCHCRTFKKKGYRKSRRQPKTDIGRLTFPLHLVECCGCGKKFAPVLDVLKLGYHQQKTESLEQVVIDAVSETSYRRGSRDVEARGCAPVPHSSAHRWAVSRVIPERPTGELQSAMADGTGFKKWPGEKGQVRLVIGLGAGGSVHGLGTYAGKSWEEIAREVKKKLRGKQQQLLLFAGDGEPGMEEHLADVARYSQRCTWHFPRDLGYAMWKDDVSLAERKENVKDLMELVAIEIPKRDWEEVRPQDKQALRENITEKEKDLELLLQDFRTRGYVKAATYLENAMGRIFEHVRLWLETGIIAPRTTSILESIMREIGRRLKKIAWNWSDAAAEKMARMVLMRHYEPDEWDAFWQEVLGLQGRCTVEVVSVQRAAT